ncbi:glycoside hydrolase family 3 protein [Kineosporia sp. J2-2]|uniref:beta-glucosidase n=1 Tax=Kineosporia corallincola TaxID=2835133 RepID=A0ABS5TLU8_9ACTN|nr:glycoside hydrolase family 3 protein [Kineosporia corallincola]MBT0771985.1 glycoside hydrolase family 3 protein [Kineosporia corallincola]
MSSGKRHRLRARLGIVAPLAGFALVLAPLGAARADSGAPYLDPDRPVRARVADLLGRMTLAEKIGQMTQGERAPLTTDTGAVTELGLGSVLSGGGSVPTPNTPQAWADMVDGFQKEALATRLKIPMIYGVDSVHGNGNLLGATIFPHNIGLGASRDPALVRQAAQVTAAETRATGVPWVFAPCLCVTRDSRWGRGYESFGETPELVTAMTTAIDGFQGTRTADLKQADRVLATAKHFAGDGDTVYGTGSGEYPIDQGVTRTSRARFAQIDLAPFVSAVKQRDVGSVMPSYSSVDWTDDGLGNPVKMHAHQELLTGWLKQKTGFDGFVISDYNAIDQLPGTFAEQVTASVNAGVDMFMEPSRYREFVTTLTAEVEAGRVKRSRIDDAVSRILTKKFELGLFENPYADRSGIADIGSAQHRAVARRAVAQSQVLLKNSGNLLPLKKNAKVYVAGRNADDIGNQAGGWTLTWQGFSGNENQQPGTTVLEGIREVAPKAEVTYSEDGTAPAAGSDVAVVVVGETPYAEGYGDVGGPEWPWDPADGGVPREEKSLALQPGDQATVDRVCAAVGKCVVLVVSGRPQVVSTSSGVDALVASWLPGTEGAGVADVLFGKRAFTGKLPVTWPATAAQEPINVGDKDYRPAYPYGYGLTTRTS